MGTFQKHYLYRYIREDKNEVFYVGIGTKHSDIFYTHAQEFRRAYNKQSRNKHFKNIINKSKYYLEIILESNNHNFIKEKEIEFIKLYGLKINGGTLCNISEGGESGSGVKKSEKERQQMSKRMSGSNNPQCRKVINIKTKKVYNSIIEASKDYDKRYDTLLSKLSGHQRNNTDFIYLEDYSRGYLPESVKNKCIKNVIDLETGRIFNTVRECAKHFNKSPTYICGILKGKIIPKKEIINIDYYDSKK